MRRNRLLYAALTGFVLLAGLASRRYLGEVPFVRAYVGDALWALMVFLAIACVWNRWPTGRVAGVTLLFSFGIEFGQLYHAPWIDSLRATRLGGLVLGFSFLWSDLLCYSAGVLAGLVIDKLLIAFQNRHT